jgi:nucleoid DNA-binding protein
MGKISLPELASTLQERRQLNKKEASQFVNEMFRIIQESLDQDKLVKVKGLGTFRIIDVEDRESVNVNTGDRVLIEGHGKITFTPDALMKELVNKPFSQFETVVLNEGVDFDDATLDENTIAEPAPSERSSEPISELSSEAIPEPADQAYDNPSVAPLVDFVTDPDFPDNPDNPDNQDIPDIPDNQDSPDIPGSPETPASEDTPEPEPRKWLWPLIALATCIIGFVAGYFLGKETTVQPWTPDQTIVEKPSPAIPAKDSLQSAPQTDSTAKGIQPDAMPSPARQDEPIKTVEAPLMKKEAPQKTADAPAKKVDAPAKKVEAPAKKPEAPAKKTEASPKPATPATTVESPDKYEQMDVRIRIGAYRIVGLDHTLKVRPGDNLARICKRTLGPGMECYIEVFNGIKGDADLKAGQTIKIPKLQSKRKKTRN